MNPLYDDDKDERIHLRDRGVGRDIGRNPLYDGTKPHTRQDTRALATMRTVGGYGGADEEIVSMGARAIGITGFSQQIAGGPGALRGVSVWTETATVFCLRSDSMNGGILWIASVDAGKSVTCQFGDWGISFNRLYLTVDVAVNARGAVWIGATE